MEELDSVNLLAAVLAVVVPIVGGVLLIQWQKMKLYVKNTANPYDDVVVGTIEDFAKMVADMAAEEKQVLIEKNKKEKAEWAQKEMPINEL